MSAVQRKLVHKQFNSPMGLYSQANVNATLNRELKAFGADGIEIDDSTSKPLNLANSAVLRAVEEEDQLNCEEKWQRPSRARHRPFPAQHPTTQTHQQLLEQIKTHYFSHQQNITVDRDTVLKINRLSTRRNLYKRDHSWPPSQCSATGSASATAHEVAAASLRSSPHDNVIHFDDTLCKRHSIDKIREKFDSPPARCTTPTARPLQTSPRRTAKSFPTPPAKILKDGEDSEDDRNTPTAKGFSAPETKAADVDIGIVAPKCEYFEQLAVSGSRRSNKSITAGPGSTLSPGLQRWQKRQSQSLERVQRRKRGDDLPPPKPRSSSVTARINGGRQKFARAVFTSAQITTANVGQLAEPGLMLSGNTQKQIVDSANELLMSNDSVQDIENLPLPPTPQPGERIKSVASAEHLQPEKKQADRLTTKRQQQLLSETKKSGQQAHIIPVTLEQASETKHSVASVQTQQDSNASAAQTIYDDACIYLRSIDLEDHTVAYIPAAITIVPTPSADEVDQQDEWWLENDICSKAQPTDQLGSMYTSSRELSLTRQNTVDTSIRSQDGGKKPASAATDAAPKVETVSESLIEENTLDIAQIEKKYANIQKSITEHLKQIDAYMENAKNALKHGVEEHQQQLKILSTASAFSSQKQEQLWRSASPSIETPLQTILRQISGASATPTDPDKVASDKKSTDENPIENVAIVEEALKDLTHFSDTIGKSVVEPSITGSAERNKRKKEETLQPDDNSMLEAASKGTKQLSLCVDFAHTAAAANCAICAACSQADAHASHTWGKVTPKDQYRSENMHNEHFDTYVATYEIPSPYISRQISWEDMFQSEIDKHRTPTDSNQHRNTLEIVHEPGTDMRQSAKPRSTTTINATVTGSHEQTVPSRAPTPNSTVGRSPARELSAEATTYVPQINGHNVGLLVRTKSPQITGGSNSAAIEQPPKLPSENVRCSSQPPPFEFLMQHGAASAAAVAVRGSHDYIQSRRQTPPPVLATADDADQSMSRRDHAVNRAFDNVSPRPYIAIEGYKRVAWPPVSEERIIREFTPQPHGQSPAPGNAAPQSADAHQHQQQHPPAAAGSVQGPIYNNTHNQPSGYHNPPYQNPNQQPSQAAPTYQPQPQHQQQQYQQPHYQPRRQQEQVPEQPIQYSQAQFNRPSQPHETAAEGPQYSAAPQPSYQQNSYPREPSQSHEPNHYQQIGQQGLQEPNHGWRPISGPAPKQGSQFYSHPGGQQNYPSYQNEHPSQPQDYGTPQQQQQQQRQPQYNQVGPQQSYQPPNQQYQNQPSQYQNHSQQNPDPHYHQQQQQQQPNQWNQQQQQQPQYQPGYPVQAPSQVNTPYAPQSNYPNYPQTQYQPQSQFGPTTQNYSVPQNQQHQPISQDQTDQFPPQALPQDYRGGSPGIITLRKETPVTQKPSPIYNSQPAATSYQGGSKLRGDLKWPPPEYKEAAVRENEERRKLALGPVCRPRRVNKDYTTFFAQNALNSTYPSYKVPPGTQHMLA